MPGGADAAPLSGAVVDGEGKLMQAPTFGLVYDDTQGVPHIDFPTGWLVYG